VRSTRATGDHEMETEALKLLWIRFGIAAWKGPSVLCAPTFQAADRL